MNYCAIPPTSHSQVKMEDSDPPLPPTNQGGFKGKRVKGRKKRKQQSVQEEHPADVPLPDATPAPSQETIDFKYTTKQEYADMLASCKQELVAALSDIDKKNKLIDKLNTKVNQLTGVISKSRSVAREVKELAKNAALDKQKASKMIKVQAAIMQRRSFSRPRRIKMPRSIGFVPKKLIAVLELLLLLRRRCRAS